MTSVSDEKWQLFNCFFSRFGLRTYQHPCICVCRCRKCYRCDVSDRDAVLSQANKVKEEVGDVSILINNAGIMHCHPLLRHTPQEIRKTYDINVLAHFWVSFSGHLQYFHTHSQSFESRQLTFRHRASSI